MRNFYQFIEGVIDPKRNPKKRPYEKMGELPSPEDDNYDPKAIDAHDAHNDDFGDDDDYQDRYGSKLGLTAQYPLARASGKMRGFQIKTPKQALRQPDVIDDKLSGRELFDTLRNKSKTGEKMTSREIDLLLKLLNKQDAKLDAQIKHSRYHRRSI